MRSCMLRVLGAAVGATLVATAGSAQIVVEQVKRPVDVNYVVCWAKSGPQRFISGPVVIDTNDFEWMQNAFEKAVVPAGAPVDNHACSSGKTADEAMGHVVNNRRYSPGSAVMTNWTGPFKVRGVLHRQTGVAEASSAKTPASTASAEKASPPKPQKPVKPCNAPKGSSCVSPQ